VVVLHGWDPSFENVFRCSGISIKGNGISASEDAGKMRGVLKAREQILAALKANWVVAGPKGAAALLGMARSTPQAHIQRFGIRVSLGRRSPTARSLPRLRTVPARA
jgi:hypothetical protein